MLALSFGGIHLLRADPALDYATYLGGSGEERTAGIAVDSSGNIYIAGSTRSAGFLGRGASETNQDAFVVKLNAAGTSTLYTTTFGGAGRERVAGIAVDSSGAAYVVGTTTSGGFATTGAYQTSPAGDTDLFIVKLDAQGAISYATFLGGEDEDGGSGIALDSSGNAYVTGYTYSDDFPTTLDPIQGALGGGMTDAFVAKLNASGTGLVYSTYLGGGAVDRAYDIAVDGAGNAFVTGTTGSDDFPAGSEQELTLSGPSNAFVTKVQSGGAAISYTKLFGGEEGADGFSVAVDGSGNAYAAGITSSSDFPVANAVQSTLGGGADAFLVKLNSSAAVQFATYVGGSKDERAPHLTVDSSGRVYVAGTTLSTNFPTASPVQSQNGGGLDLFVARLQASGSALDSATYFGGSGWERATGIAADSSGDAYVVGRTKSSDFPIEGALQSTLGGRYDAVIVKIEP